MDTVFYSWQSDLDAKTNRFFIADALEKAVKLLKRDGIQVDSRIDQDARDCPGAPDIATELFRKIRACRVFVADVSIINPNAFMGLGGKKQVGLSKEGVVYKYRQEKPCRPTPNPNVMIELGYAAHALTWDRVICVINEAYGVLEKLPFDIRARSMVRFNLLPTANEEVRKHKNEALRDWLKGALEVAIARNEEEIGERQRQEEETVRQRVSAEELQRHAVQQQEIARQDRLLEVLRRHYCYTHENLPPGILSGADPVPKEWVEQQLAQRGESWRREVYY
jgi:hypothetical protein